MTEGSPWADPSTPTEPGPPYWGPPAPGPGYGPTANPPGYPPPGYGPPAGWSPYGPPWGPPPAPRRPAQVVAAAVLAFVQAGVVALASAYVLFFASIAGLATGDPDGPPVGLSRLVTEGTVLSVVQLFSVVLLLVGGVLALARRSRTAWLVLLAAHGVQVLLAGYWAVRLLAVLSALPGPDPSGAFVAFSLVFAAGPAVGLGLLLLGPGRRWFAPAAPGA